MNSGTRTGMYYLNNRGDRWVVYENGQKPRHTFLTKTGRYVTRTAIFYESFGNFATIRINYRGQKLDVFPDTVLEG